MHMALVSQGLWRRVMKPFFSRTSASFLMFCLEQPRRFPDWVKVRGSCDCLTMDSSMNCFRDSSCIWLSNRVCSLFPAMNRVLKIALPWSSLVPICQEKALRLVGPPSMFPVGKNKIDQYRKILFFGILYKTERMR